MKKAFILACGCTIAMMGCTGKTEVKTKGGADDKPFGTYQSGIDRAREEQKNSVTRSATEDSAAAAAKDGGQGQ
jgi:hypothetical protein